MDWFARLTGFPETTYEKTRRLLEVDGSNLRSLVNGRSYGIGEFTVVSLQSLREQVQSALGHQGSLRVRVTVGDVRRLHHLREYADALFQVASQFNMLEMTSPSVTPENGVARYAADPTQGPACAIAAGAATIYRNYFARVGGATGQTHDCQLDGLSGIGTALREALDIPVEALWRMRNGYALCTATGLDAITRYLESSSSAQIDRLRSKLCIGLHRDVEVTDSDETPRPTVSQAFCSALPVAYSPVPRSYWQAFATLVLESAYEATMWAALQNARSGKSNVVLLTSLGGGAFGNSREWIHAAIRRSLRLAADFDLEVRIVSYGPPCHELLTIAADYS
jgi:hypothetical protein